MNQKIAIKPFSGRSFGVVLRAVGASAPGARVLRRRRSEEAAGLAGGLVPQCGLATGVAVGVEMPPVDAGGLVERGRHVGWGWWCEFSAGPADE